MCKEAGGPSLCRHPHNGWLGLAPPANALSYYLDKSSKTEHFLWEMNLYSHFCPSLFTCFSEIVRNWNQGNGRPNRRRLSHRHGSDSTPCGRKHKREAAAASERHIKLNKNTCLQSPWWVLQNSRQIKTVGRDLCRSSDTLLPI